MTDTTLARAIRDHRETCVVLAIKAGLAIADGEEIRAALDKADADLLTALRSTAAGSVDDLKWLDGNEIWEHLFGITKGDVPDGMTEEVCSALADRLKCALSQVSGRDAVFEECADLQFHLDRLDAWLLDLWAAKSIDLHQCDGTRKEDQHGLLSDIREDVMALRRAIRSLSTKPAEPSRDAVVEECAALADGYSRGEDDFAELANRIRALASTKAGTKSGYRTDMENMPKDGRVFHVWAPGFEWPETVRWETYEDGFDPGDGTTGYWSYAETLLAEVTDSCGSEEWTHWRDIELPAPPAPAQGEE